MPVKYSIAGLFLSGLAGLIAAYYALLAHYGGADTGFCELGEAFSCDAVNQSQYAAIYGIPFALIGIIGYVFLFSALIWFAKTRSELAASAVLSLSIIGFGIQLYLTFIEAFVLRMWCLLCVISQVAIALVLLFAILIYKANKQEDSNG